MIVVAIVEPFPLFFSPPIGQHILTLLGCITTSWLRVHLALPATCICSCMWTKMTLKCRWCEWGFFKKIPTHSWMRPKLVGIILDVHGNETIKHWRLILFSQWSIHIHGLPHPRTSAKPVSVSTWQEVIWESAEDIYCVSLKRTGLDSLKRFSYS